jgi:hypothetical protein
MIIGKVTLWCIYQPMMISVMLTLTWLELLTQVSCTVSGGVGARRGRVSVMRPGDVATGYRPIV